MMEHDCRSAVATMGVVVCDFFTKSCEKNVGRAGWLADVGAGTLKSSAFVPLRLATWRVHILEVAHVCASSSVHV